MNSRSIHDLNQCILNNLHKLPEDIEVIVGVPRSGMLVAMMIALHRNAVVTDVDGLIRSTVMSGGTATHDSGLTDSDFLKTARKVLLIDDSHYRGNSIRQVKGRIEAASLSHEILYGVVYGGLRAKDDVDLVFERLLPPHLFEWNLSRNVVLERTCLDMDGVLCRNPLPIEDDDGDRYRKFLRNAQLLWRPQRRVGWIVTSRLEKYRELTVQWLKQHRVAYQHLLMMNQNSQTERRRADVPGYKADAYRSTTAELFVESSIHEAIEIASRTRRNVFCFETAEFIPASRCEEFKSRMKNPASLLNPFFLYSGYLFRKFPEDHPVIGPLRNSGRRLFRLIKQRSLQRKS